MLTCVVAVNNKNYSSFDLLYVTYVREISVLFSLQTNEKQKTRGNQKITAKPPFQCIPVVKFSKAVPITSRINYR